MPYAERCALSKSSQQVRQQVSGTSEQIQQLLIKMKTRLRPSQREGRPNRRDTDLTDDRQIQGNYLDSTGWPSSWICRSNHARTANYELDQIEF